MYGAYAKGKDRQQTALTFGIHFVKAANCPFASTSYALGV